MQARLGACPSIKRLLLILGHTPGLVDSLANECTRSGPGSPQHQTVKLRGEIVKDAIVTWEVPDLKARGKSYRRSKKCQVMPDPAALFALICLAEAAAAPVKAREEFTHASPFVFECRPHASTVLACPRAL